MMSSPRTDDLRAKVISTMAIITANVAEIAVSESTGGIKISSVGTITSRLRRLSDESDRFDTCRAPSEMNLAPPVGLEPTTSWSEARRSVQLSYGGSPNEYSIAYLRD
jgi:hypothetical protein